MQKTLMPLVVGVALVSVAIGVTATTHDSALATLVALGGVVLVLFALIGDRLKSVGPSGVELYERLKEPIAILAAGGLAKDASAAIPGISESGDATTRARAEAAAAIRRTKTPEELVEVLVRITDPAD